MNNQTYKGMSSGHGQLRVVERRCRTVYIVDDDPAVCHALVHVFENANYAVKPFTSAGSLLAATNEETTGVLILDLFIADMSGLELQAELMKRGIGLKIIFISGYGNVEKSVLAIKGGAIDFIEKPFSNTQLLNSVKEAMSLVHANEKERRRRHFLEKRYRLLTLREREVLKFLVNGVPNRELAERLGLSRRTVEIHRSNIMHKMEAGSLPELVHMVYGNSNTPPEEILIELRQSLQFREEG